MKYPQRAQTILQRLETSRFPHTGQNWFGSSSRGGWLSVAESVLLMANLLVLK